MKDVSVALLKAKAAAKKTLAERYQEEYEALIHEEMAHQGFRSEPHTVIEKEWKKAS